MNSNEKKPNLSIAIPKAKPQMERVSPGVYRDTAGKLVRSNNGGSGSKSASPNRQFDPSNLARFLPLQPPKTGGLLDSVPTKPYPLPLNDNIRRLIDLMGGGNGPGARPIPKMPGRDIDPGYAADPRLIPGTPFARAVGLGNPDPGSEMPMLDIPPELRRLMDGAMNGATPQIPRSGGSVADLLRRR